jgi:hypothetical protein
MACATTCIKFLSRLHGVGYAGLCLINGIPSFTLIIFTRMKKCIGYILFLYILFCAVVPCTIIDNYEDESTEQTSHKNTNKDCNNCSPFSICSPSPGFTIGAITTTIAPVIPETLLVYSNYYFSFKSEYYSSFFQPPRSG